MPRYGIDVSFCQENFDFNQAVAEGRDFCICKMSQGRHDGSIYMDDLFVQNINGALNAGMEVGVYHFFGATNPDDAVTEANNFIDLYNQYITPGVCDNIGVWLDVEAEVGQVLDGVDSKTLTDSVFAFILQCNKAGINIGIYANYDWFTNKLDLSQFANYIKLWVAEPGYNYVRDENPSRTNPIWQYDFHGNIGGVEVDYDLMYD